MSPSFRLVKCSWHTHIFIRSRIVIGGQVDVRINKCALEMRKCWMEQMNREFTVLHWTSIHNWPHLLFVFEDRKLRTRWWWGGVYTFQDWRRMLCKTNKNLQLWSSWGYWRFSKSESSSSIDWGGCLTTVKGTRNGYNDSKQTVSSSIVHSPADLKSWTVNLMTSLERWKNW